ncbi:MAG: sulfur oxidation c-type cytochrome SoxX [Gammaproteobacteria bacterium]|nr:sulfur oxidation c-type cytochrome SoxX [Gammaproteobacteria bacterium]
MRIQQFKAIWLGAVALVMSASFVPTAVADSLPDENQCKKNKPTETVTAGWCAAIIRQKGNCLACHYVTTQRPWPETLAPGGNIAPPLVSMKTRFPDKAKLRAQIWDSTQANPQSSMPPFGKHGLLSESEIDAIVEWLQTI